MSRVLPAVLSAMVVVSAACTADDDPGVGDPAGPPTPGPSPPSAPRPEVGTWTALADLPRVRGELSAVALDGVVYAGGGLARGADGSGFYAYDVDSDTWRELAPMPDGRHHAPLAGHDGRVYVVGGYSDTGTAEQGLFTPVDTLFVYDVAGDTWREGPALPEQVGAHAVATTDDGMIHVVGGIGEDYPPTFEQHLVFDTAAETWSTLPEMPSHREHLGAAYLDGVVYTAAGRFGSGSAFEAYHVATQEWTSLPDVPTARSGVAVVAFAGQIYVFGGEFCATGDICDHAERFDPAAGTWEEVAPMPAARHGLGGAAVDDGIILVGGGTAPGFSYSARTEIWRP